MSTQTHSPAGLRSSLANAAWVVEERVVWGSADFLRGTGGFFRNVFEVIKWPFERAAWAIERGAIWPLEERLGVAWDGPLRVAGIALVTVVAIGAGVAGLLWAAPDGGGNATKLSAIPPVTSPVISQATPEVKQSGPTLHGPAPVFSPPAGESKPKAVESVPSEATAAGTAAAPDTSAAAEATDTPAAATAGAKQPAAPSATEVARQFAGAFVLYETGEVNSKVRSTFHATATPALARSLLSRPPRLPANVKVPRAKVLNVVLGPSHNGVNTISVSLLRVGLTSELRLDMQKDKNGDPQVTNVLG